MVNRRNFFKLKVNKSITTHISFVRSYYSFHHIWRIQKGHKRALANVSEHWLNSCIEENRRPTTQMKYKITKIKKGTGGRGPSHDIHSVLFNKMLGWSSRLWNLNNHHQQQPHTKKKKKKLNKRRLKTSLSLRFFFFFFFLSFYFFPRSAINISFISL